jgi:hypothetical protein
MRRPTCLQILWFLSLVAVMAGASPVSAQCPQSTVSCAGNKPNGDVFDVSETSDAPAAQVSYGRKSSASYDLVDRTVQAVASVWADESYRVASGAVAVGRFELHGVVAAWVTIRMTLTVSGATDPAGRQAWVAGSARLTARDQTATAETDTPHMIAPFIEISTYLLEGEPLELTYELAAEGFGHEPEIALSGHLEFIGLPDGAVVTPCVSSPPVPVEATSWGAVKALYR